MAKAKIAKREEARLKEELQADENKSELPAPPDGGYGWVIVLASFICNMVVDGVSFTFGLILPFLMEYYGSSKGVTAWVGSLYVGFQMGTGPIVSAIANKFGCRITSLAGCALGSTALALSTLCPSIPLIMLVYGVLGGFGFAMIYLPAVVMVGYYFESKRSLATGMAVCGTGVGAFAFAPLANFLVNSYGWKTTNLCLAGIAAGCAVFAALMKPLVYEEIIEEVVEVPKNMTTRPSEGNISIPGVYNSTLSITKRKASLAPLERKDVLYTGSIQNLREFRSKSSLAEFRNSMHSIQKVKRKNRKSSFNILELIGTLVDLSLLKDMVFMMLAISTVFAMIGFYIPFVYIVELAKSKGISETQGSMLISIIGITNIVSRLVIGYIADFPKVNNFLVNNGCIMISAAAMVVMPLCPSFTTLTAASVFFGIGIAGYISLTSIVLVEFLGIDRLTNTFGMLLLFRGVSAAFGSPLAGTLYDMTQSYTVPFFVGGAVFAVAGVISMLAPCFRKKPTEVDGEVLAPMNVKGEKKENVV